jgi:hypothetical protein
MSLSIYLFEQVNWAILDKFDPINQLIKFSVISLDGTKMRREARGGGGRVGGVGHSGG